MEQDTESVKLDVVDVVGQGQGLVGCDMETEP